MHFPPRRLALLLLLATALLAGCGRKEISPLDRKEAAHLASQADFAVNLRDYPRAEGLLTEAVKLCPDSREYYLSLGIVRRRQDNRSGAKQAYEQALDLARDAYKANDKDTQPLLQQAYILALLGRMDDARDVVAKAQQKHPDDSNVRIFVENNQLDRMIAAPGFKAVSIAP